MNDVTVQKWRLEYWQTQSGSGQYRERLEGYLEAILQRDVPLHEWDGPQQAAGSFWPACTGSSRLASVRTPVLFMAERQGRQPHARRSQETR